jgi:hypothetical protein
MGTYKDILIFSIYKVEFEQGIDFDQNQNDKTDIIIYTSSIYSILFYYTLYLHNKVTL